MAVTAETTQKKRATDGVSGSKRPKKKLARAKRPTTTPLTEEEASESLQFGAPTSSTNKLNIARNLFQGEEKKTKKGKIKKGRTFVLPHCYEVLKDVEKWKARDDQEESKKRKSSIDLDDDEEASSDYGKRSPTLNSIAYSKPKRPNGSKKEAKEKKKMRGDDELTNAMDALLAARKEATEVALEEKKLAMEERARLLEWEKLVFFMDTSTFDDRQKEFINLSHDEALAQKRSMGMGGFRGMRAIMGGLRRMGGFEGMGTTMSDMGGMCGIEETMGGMEDM
ncbi:tyrosine n-monooxygenase [Hordeum vulgare]|nr:tyrosine n-monooxygenase [Hordeum vulgare]